MIGWTAVNVDLTNYREHESHEEQIKIYLQNMEKELLVNTNRRWESHTHTHTHTQRQRDIDRDVDLASSVSASNVVWLLSLFLYSFMLFSQMASF